MPESLISVRSAVLRGHVLEALKRYWPKGRQAVERLPVAESNFPKDCSIPQFIQISLPDWAKQCGVNGSLLVPEEACASRENWRQVDWWLSAFLMLEGWHERNWELRHGPIHSYSFRLKGWDKKVWQRAWVNRIALFLRAWAANEQGRSEQDIFGSLPKAEIIITHDVDAVAKSLPIRAKQCIFNLFKAGQAIASRNHSEAVTNIMIALRFLFGTDDWWTLDELLELEKKEGVRSHFNFHADQRRKNLKRWIFDPSYDITSRRIQRFMQRAMSQGFTVGLHPCFDAWKVSTLIQTQKKNLEASLGHEVSSCRQHWLRFSWQNTWDAQEKTGIELDTTLMFNDRPGFRNSAALQWNPFNANSGSRHTLYALPTVFMDSHLYDYQAMTDVERKKHIVGWIEEINQVAGQAALLWHPHTLTKTYGWQAGFRDMLLSLPETAT